MLLVYASRKAAGCLVFYESLTGRPCDVAYSAMGYYDLIETSII